MCNINILIGKEKFNRNHKIIACFMQSVTAASYLSNCFADGVYFNGTNNIYKDYNKLNLLEYSQEIKKSDIIITHQRLATSGFHKESNQPFIKDGFIFVHNGVLSGYVDHKNSEKSDSLNLFEKIIEIYNLNKNKGLSRDEVIILSIKECLEDKTGSFSIVLYDIENKSLYYFKNSVTDIHFFRGKHSLFITTKQDNKVFLGLLNEKSKKVKVKDNSIYKIFLEKDDIKILKIGKIKHKTYFIPSSSCNVVDITNKYYFNKHDPTPLKPNDLDYNSDYKMLEHPNLCFYCKKPTYRFNKVYNHPICEFCDSDLNKYPDYV